MTMLVATKPVLKRDEVPPPHVKRFLDYIFLECGLSGETVTAYKRDLQEFWNDLLSWDVQPDEITCTCGTTNKQGSKFCNECGALHLQHKTQRRSILTFFC